MSNGGGEVPPNLLLIITDQQRRPQHWPDDPEWLEKLTPADAEISRTGVTFTETCAASCMCSPSRASLLTGRWPDEHGVKLTLTQGGAKANPRHAHWSVRGAFAAVRNGELSAADAFGTVAKGAVRRPDGGDEERDLDPATPNIATVLKRAGYRTVLKGKWHLSQPVDGDWGPGDTDHLADSYGLHDWEPPDAGENIEASHFGGGSGAGRSRQGFDEDFTRQAERFLADPPPEPWALIFSLVNPHDVLGYPSTFEQGGYDRSEWADLGEIDLPESAGENLASKPRVQATIKLGQAAFLGGLNGDEEKLDYCRFYAHLQRLVDEKVGRILAALGDPEDDESLRSKTVIVRTSDHGEMGMSHGGLRQKMFNAYDETINVPLVISNPILFSEPAASEAPASLCDILPTLASIAGVDTSGDGVRGRDLTPVLAAESKPDRNRLASSGLAWSAVSEHPEPARSVQEFSYFTFDDHQSGTAYRDVVARPNQIRAVRSPEAMYAVYLDESGGKDPEYELYDMKADPDQIRNLVDRDSGEVIDSGYQDLLERTRTALEEAGAR
ncbi:MAG: sulfatase-like hydrolase/transferase [Thermoleophilia bacterium]|nr:sulfatase-like hydrolase/transferase [Thermoleophilia bacterium]